MKNTVGRNWLHTEALYLLSANLSCMEIFSYFVPTGVLLWWETQHCDFTIEANKGSDREKNKQMIISSPSAPGCISNANESHSNASLKAQNRWDLRAGANSQSKAIASVLRWRPRYDSPTAFGVHGRLVMKPTEISVDKRDARNSRADWKVTFLRYSRFDPSSHVFVRCGCVCAEELHAGTMQRTWHQDAPGATASKWDSFCADRPRPHHADVNPDQKILDEQTTEREVTKSDNKLYSELFWCHSNTVWHHHAPERKIMMQYLAISH